MNRTSQTRIYLRHCPHILAHDVDGLDGVQYRGRHENSIAALLSLYSKLKSGDIITTGQHMNYQSFSKLQFRPLLKNSFHSIEIDLRTTSGEKTLCICRYHSFVLFRCSEKPPKFISNLKDVPRWLLQDK